MSTTLIKDLPVLRNGKEALSASKKPLMAISGEKITDVSLSPEMHLQMAMPLSKGAGFKRLSQLSIDELIGIYDEAGRIFASDLEVMGREISLDDWARLITMASGLPISVTRANMHMISEFFKRPHLERFLKAASPTGELEIYDELVGERGNTKFAFGPRGKNVGIALPGNHPGVALFGCLIPLFKLPAIIRSSSSEPFTSFRICKALWDAGMPYSALFHFVTGHAEVDTLVRKSDLGIVFGSDWTNKMYGNDNMIKAYGPGKSKVLVDIERMNPNMFSKALDVAYQSIIFDGGRGCINASGIIWNSEKDTYSKFKHELAQKLSTLVPYDPLDEEAQLPAMAKPKARALQKFINQRMQGNVRDVVQDYRNYPDFVYVDDEYAFLLPMLLELEETHEMREDEYPFPFGTIYQPDDYYAHELVRNSLSVSLVTDDKEKARAYLREPSIEKVFVNDSSFTMDLAAPHEGFLTDFLYQKKATNL